MYLPETCVCALKPLSYKVYYWRKCSTLFSGKKVSPKTWRIFMQIDAISMTANTLSSWYLPLTRLISEPAEAFTPPWFSIKNNRFSQGFFVLWHHVLLVLNVLITSTWFSVFVQDILAIHDIV